MAVGGAEPFRDSAHSGLVRRPQGELGLLPYVPMRLLSVLACAALSACSTPPRSTPHQFSVLLGARTLDNDDIWAPVEDEMVAGMEYSLVGQSGFGLELGGLASGRFDVRVSDDVRATGAVAEVYLGLRREFVLGGWRPYLGGGGVLLAAGIDNDSGGLIADDEDASAAVYLHGGLLYKVAPSLSLGVDVRLVTGSSLEFEGIEGDADYAQLALVIATSF